MKYVNVRIVKFTSNLEVTCVELLGSNDVFTISVLSVDAPVNGDLRWRNIRAHGFV